MTTNIQTAKSIQKFSLKISTEKTKNAHEDFSFSQKLIPEEKATSKNENPLIKRISPFMLLTLTFLFLFPYMIFTGTGNIHSEWLKGVIFPFAVMNILFADFAIWNYFGGKKRGIIWIVELTVSIALLYFLT